MGFRRVEGLGFRGLRGFWGAFGGLRVQEG